MNAKCLDEEALLFFDFLMSQKVRLYKVLYPHLDLMAHNQRLGPNGNRINIKQQRNNQVVIPDRLSFTDFLMFFQKNID